MRQPTPGSEQGLLDGVLGVLHRREHAVTVRMELGAVDLDQVAVGALFASSGPFQQGLL
jgi:hypothetical protein